MTLASRALRNVLCFLALFYFFCLLSAINVFASQAKIEDVWQMETTIPFDFISEPTAASVGDKIYVVKGNRLESNYLTRTQVYNATTKQWSQLGQNFPWASGSNLYFDVSAVAYGDYIYILISNIGNQSFIASFNTLTGVWNLAASLSANRLYGKITLVGDKIYILGGRAGAGSYRNSMAVFDIPSNTLVENGTLPVGVSSPANMFPISYNNELYAADNATRKVYLYDAAAQTWSYVFDLFPANAGNPYYLILNNGIASQDGTVYMALGDRSKTYNSVRIIKYDLHSRAYQILSESYTKETAFRDAYAFVGDKIYTFGGDTNKILSYDTGGAALTYADAQYEYDETGRLKKAVYDSDQTITYVYDDAGNITSALKN
jgi:hypothetical protein